MPVSRPRSAMRKIREILRLSHADGLSRRQVAAVGLPYTTVADYLERARRKGAGLGWPLPEGVDEVELEARLFVSAASPPGHSQPLPDWSLVHRELRRPGVTLQLLHMEYKERQPDGYQYTQFCDLYRRWQRHLDVVMRHDRDSAAGTHASIYGPAPDGRGRVQTLVGGVGARCRKRGGSATARALKIPASRVVVSVR
jgi:hypothetical protein